MIDQSEIIRRVNATLTESFEIQPLDLQENANLFKDLGLDSLDGIDLLVYLEENFGVQVKGEVFKDVRTLGDVYRLVGNLANSPKGQV